MRLGRTAWLILGLGIFVMAVATLFTVYLRQSSEQEELENNLVGAGARLPKLISEREALASQLTEQQGKLAETQSLLSEAGFPALSASIEYDEVLAEIADACNLEVMSMKAEEPSEKKVEGVTYLVISFEVGVKGDEGSILGMVNAIATDERFTSATVELVNIKIPEAVEEEGLETTVVGGEAEGEEAEGEEPGQPLGTIKLVGYSYRGE